VRLDKPTIVRAALDLLDEAGFDGLTTRTLAQRLGVKGPSLYWHFKSKQELLDHMAEALLAEAMRASAAAAAGRPRPTWDVWLESGARVVRSAALSRRDGARVLAGARPTHSRPELDTGHMFTRMEDSGLSQAEAAYAMMGLARYAIGWAMDEQGAAGRASLAAGETGFAPGRIDYEAGFEFGLAMAMNGIRARAAEGAAKPRGAISR
jgi:TetR/AcrR family transcriptional regulator, tetracycline repressor protein